MHISERKRGAQSWGDILFLTGLYEVDTGWCQVVPGGTRLYKVVPGDTRWQVSMICENVESAWNVLKRNIWEHLGTSGNIWEPYGTIWVWYRTVKNTQTNLSDGSSILYTLSIHLRTLGHLDHRCEIWLILWNMTDIVIFGCYCEILLKLWNFAEIVKFGRNR